MILQLQIGNKAKRPDNIQTAISQQQLVNTLLSERMPQSMAAPNAQPQPQPAKGVQ